MLAFPPSSPRVTIAAYAGASVFTSSTETLKDVRTGPMATLTLARYLPPPRTSTSPQPGTQGATSAGFIAKSQTRSIGAPTRKASSIFMIRCVPADAENSSDGEFTQIVRGVSNGVSTSREGGDRLSQPGFQLNRAHRRPAPAMQKAGFPNSFGSFPPGVGGTERPAPGSRPDRRRREFLALTGRGRAGELLARRRTPTKCSASAVRDLRRDGS